MHSIISCRAVFVMVNSQEIVAGAGDWNERMSKNWRAKVGKSLDSLMKIITKLRSD